MDSLTPRSLEAVREAQAADQVTPRSAREADEVAALRKEVALAAVGRASPRPSPRAGAAGAAAAAAGALGAGNLKQLAAAARAALSPAGSGPSTPRGGLARDREAQGSAQAAAHHSPRMADQMQKRPPLHAAPSPRMADPAAASIDDDRSPNITPRPAPGAPAASAPAAARAPASAAAPAATAPARAQPALHLDVSSGHAASPRPQSGADARAAAAGAAAAANLGFWRTRSGGLPAAASAGSGGAAARGVLGRDAEGLTAAEIMLMGVRRPSGGDEEGEGPLWGPGLGAGAGVGVIPGGAAMRTLPGDEATLEVAAGQAATASAPVSQAQLTVEAPGASTLKSRLRRYAAPVVISVLTAALVVTMVFVFVPGVTLGGAGTASILAPALTTPATATAAATDAATAATRAAGLTATAASLGATSLVADVMGFVAMQQPAWLQPGLDASKMAWGAAPSAAQCAAMAAMPAVQFLCTGAIAA